MRPNAGGLAQKALKDLILHRAQQQALQAEDSLNAITRRADRRFRGGEERDAVTRPQE